MISETKTIFMTLFYSFLKIYSTSASNILREAFHNYLQTQSSYSKITRITREDPSISQEIARGGPTITFHQSFTYLLENQLTNGEQFSLECL